MLSDLVKLGISSVRSPRTAATQLLNVELSRATRYQFALLVVVLSGLASQLIFGIGSAEVDGTDTRMWMQSPFGTAALEAGMLTMIVLATVLVGRAFGGTGTFDDAVLLIAWLQLISLFVQAGFAVIVMLGRNLSLMGAYSSGFGVTMTVAILGYLFWMYVSFVAALHSFASTAKVFLGVVLTVLALAVAITSLLTTVFMG